jgi:Bacterial Ig-like domain (group 2)
VSSPNRTRFVAIGVVMEDPIDTFDQEATSLPARFAIKIPKGIALGSYTVTAMAGLAGRVGGEWVVAMIDVDIERREMPRAISSRNYPAGFSLLLEKKGETRDIELLGDFGNGDVVLVTESSRVTFESSDTAVATVDKSGTITAVGAGHAAVVAWYGPRDSGIKATFPVEVR